MYCHTWEHLVMTCCEFGYSPILAVYLHQLTPVLMNLHISAEIQSVGANLGPKQQTEGVQRALFEEVRSPAVRTQLKTLLSRQ